MIWVQGGSYQMGSSPSESGRGKNEELHEVSLSGFWISAVPIHSGGRPTLKSWVGATGYCEDLQEGYELPSEAQWEYACRAGSRSQYCFGSEASRLGSYGFLDWSGNEDVFEVGRKRSNRWGLYDFHAGILEWCRDRYGEYGLDKPIDPIGPEHGGYRVIRGGGAKGKSSDCRSAWRHYRNPSASSNNVGFRVVRQPYDL